MTLNALEEIKAFNAGREPERLRLKYEKMASSPFIFLRGSCHLFYARLPRGGIFKTAPRVWVCGDLHLENFGSYKADNRLSYFDINDFDESALAPSSWDLVRLLTSMRVAAADLSLKATEATRLGTALLDAYARSLTTGKAYWVERDTSTGLIRKLLDELRDRKRAAFLARRTVGEGKKRRLRVDDGRALPASVEQRKLVTSFIGEFAASEPDPAFFRVIDVARRIAGTGSLGIERYVVLVEGKGSPEGNYLLDLKASQASSLLRRPSVAQPAWKNEAERTVELQRRLQAVPMAFLHAVRLHGHPFVLRGLQPHEDRIELVATAGDVPTLEALAASLGEIVAWAELRSAARGGSATADELIDFGHLKNWKLELLAASQACAEQVLRDAEEFKAAWTGGAIAV